jgi:hypothetical protein
MAIVINMFRLNHLDSYYPAAETERYFDNCYKFPIAILNGRRSALDIFFIFVKIQPLGGSIFDADGTIKLSA